MPAPYYRETDGTRGGSFSHKHGMSGDNSRLNRIEEKLDRLTETVVALARVEEKLCTLERTTSAIQTKLNATEEKNLEGRLTAVERTHGIITKVFWSVITAGLIGALGFFARLWRAF